MRITIDDITYESVYYPYYRLEKNDDFSVYGIRYPSGFNETVLVFGVDEPLKELRVYSEFLIREYALEDDDALTPRAMRLKQDVKDLFVVVVP
jgi:hypothetical protein